MSLPYSKATSGTAALGEIQKILRAFGCTKIGNMSDESDGSVEVQFVYRGLECSVKASAKGYAQAWLKATPYTTRMHISKAQHESRAMEIGTVAIYSILRDWIKGQVAAIETGVLSFEGAFLGNIRIPGTGKTVLEHVEDKKLLPAQMLPTLPGPKP